MKQTIPMIKPVLFATMLLTALLIAGVYQQPARAAVENPKTSTFGVEGTISQPPPTKPAVISSPVSGRTFTELPITISGLCAQGTIVKIFANNIFVGAVTCSNGSFSLQVDLFSGLNEIIARVYDDLDQAGPDSVPVTVTLNDASMGSFLNRVNVTSSYARRGANPGDTLSWPVVLNGGTGPYALSIDWGDGKPTTLKSVPFAATVDIEHVYDSAGIYRIVIRASDATGAAAYLQLVGVANGALSDKDSTADTPSTITVTKTVYSFLPMLIAIPLILASFWLGRKYELQALRRRLENENSD